MSIFVERKVVKLLSDLDIPHGIAQDKEGKQIGRPIIVAKQIADDFAHDNDVTKLVLGVINASLPGDIDNLFELIASIITERGMGERENQETPWILNFTKEKTSPVELPSKACLEKRNPYRQINAENCHHLLTCLFKLYKDQEISMPTIGLVASAIVTRKNFPKNHAHRMAMISRYRTSYGLMP